MQLVTVKSAAEVLGLTDKRLYQLIDGGQLKTVEVLGRIGIKQSELERFRKIERKRGRPKSNGKSGFPKA